MTFLFWLFWLLSSGWWFQIFFIFIPIWGNDRIWLIFFEMGWSHQLVVFVVVVVVVLVVVLEFHFIETFDWLPHPGQTFWMWSQDCLKDADISIRKRALDVTYSLVDETNIKSNLIGGYWQGTMLLIAWQTIFRPEETVEAEVDRNALSESIRTLGRQIRTI